jgi:hypothetical protein
LYVDGNKVAIEDELEIVFDITPQITTSDIRHLLKLDIFGTLIEGYGATLVFLDSVLTENQVLLINTASNVIKQAEEVASHRIQRGRPAKHLERRLSS